MRRSKASVAANELQVHVRKRRSSFHATGPSGPAPVEDVRAVATGIAAPRASGGREFGRFPACLTHIRRQGAETASAEIPFPARDSSAKLRGFFASMFR